MTTRTYTTDTSAEALEVQLAGLRKMSPQERVRRTCAMSRRVRNMGFAAIRRRHPELSEEETQLLFIELTYGKPLADDVRRWMIKQKVSGTEKACSAIVRVARDHCSVTVSAV